MIKFRQPVTLQKIAEAIGAKLELVSDSMIQELAGIESAKQSSISFIINPGYIKHLADTQASAIVLTEKDAKNCNTNKLITDNPRLAIIKLIETFCPKDNNFTAGIDSTAIISKTAKIGANVTIEPNCVIGDAVTIGDNCIIGAGVVIGNNSNLGSDCRVMANVTIYSRVNIGNKSIIHSGAVIGSDGFGYALDDELGWIKMPQMGGVNIGSNVEIGSNTSIDRGFIEPTTICDNVIIDNLVQIAHNVHIGDRTAIAGCVAIAGSTFVGNECLIGGGSSIAGHIKIGNKVHITATSAVNRSLDGPGIYSSGIPARENHVWRKNVARFQNLDKMSKRVTELEKNLKRIEEQV